MLHEMDLKTLTLLSYIWSLGCVENGAPSCNGTMVLDSLISLGWATVCKAILVFESTTCQFGSSGSGGGSAMATPVEFRRFSKVDPACTSFTMVVVMFCNSSVDRSPALAVVLSSGHRKIKHEKIQISVIKFYIFNPLNTCVQLLHQMLYVHLFFTFFSLLPWLINTLSWKYVRYCMLLEIMPCTNKNGYRFVQI